MPQVASDPKIQAHSHSLPRNTRPPQQSDRAPSPFESLLDDGAQAPPPTLPDDRTARADNAQPARPPAKNNDNNKAPAANDNAATTKADDAGPVDKADNANESVSDGNAAVDAKVKKTSAAEGVITPTNTNDDKPADGKEAVATPPAGSIQTITTADAIALVPTATTAEPDQGEHVVQLPEQAAPAAEVATQSGPVDLALLKAVVGKQGDGGKQADAKEQADTGEQAEAGQVTDEDGPKLTTKPASPSHTDGKGQATAGESDKQPISQARGESPATSRHASPEASATFAADTNAAAAKSAANIAPPINVSSQSHAAQTAAAPATLVSQSGPQAGAVPLSGVAIEIASKALAGKNRFEIRLDPPELGRIEVRLDVDRDGNVTSRLTVDRADTLDLLRRDVAGLERALQDAGLKTANNGLQFSLRDQSMNQQSAGGSPNTAEIVVSDELVDATLQHYGRHAWQGNGLDIRV